MSADDGFLKSAYGLTSPEDTGAFYDRWASTYDKELQDNGYITPRRCAEALARLVPDTRAPVVDLGCGTGLSGIALRAAGFDTVDGFDYSPEMLAQAQARTGVYRHIGPIDLTQPLPFAPGTYAHACAAGVINPGHAPAAAVQRILSALPAGGMFVFSLNDHALAASECAGVAADTVRAGLARLMFEQYGDHIPGTGLRARVYVLQHTP